jgi:surface antigen
MKKWIVGLVFVLLAACGVLFAIQQYENKCSPVVSKEIGVETDSYKEVKVFNNGEDYVKDYGKNYSKDGYYYGLKWQCVEYIKRFYYDAKGHKMPDVLGHAKDFFDESVNQGELNKKPNLLQYRNGDNMKPHPDDLIVFTDTYYGHVAIVTEVTDADIEIIQQNIYGKSRDRLKLTIKDGKYTVGGGNKRSPAGWLRKDAN